MAVSLVQSHQLLYCPAHLLSSKLAQFGMPYTLLLCSLERDLTSFSSIYKPAKTATQSGDWTSHQWRMDWDPLSKGHRWENPLMGWQSSSDFMQGTHLNFNSKDDAINFANKQGYEYFVQEPNVRKIVPKAYADQFIHSPKKLKQVRTK